MSEKYLILDFILKSSQEKRTIYSSLMKKINNNILLELLYDIYNKFDELYIEIREFFKKEFLTPSTLSFTESMSTNLMVNITTAIDNSSSRVASSLISENYNTEHELQTLGQSYKISHEINNESLDQEVILLMNKYVDLTNWSTKKLQMFL